MQKTYRANYGEVSRPARGEWIEIYISATSRAVATVSRPVWGKWIKTDISRIIRGSETIIERTNRK